MLWLLEKLSDFCRWRAVAAHRRSARALQSAHGWLEVEKEIVGFIMKGVDNGSSEKA